ncbi:MAG: hypothetical protein II842_14290 [Butyrivibrio sp.]|nr:hypothetical protein [Butyrivibrio sp.]
MDNKMGKNPYACSDRGTFIVRVDHCENETWQGRVTWAEENKSEHFRSALELIKLIDGAMGARRANKQDVEGGKEGTA